MVEADQLWTNSFYREEKRVVHNLHLQVKIVTADSSLG